MINYKQIAFEIAEAKADGQLLQKLSDLLKEENPDVSLLTRHLNLLGAPQDGFVVGKLADAGRLKEFFPPELGGQAGLAPEKTAQVDQIIGKYKNDPVFLERLKNSYLASLDFTKEIEKVLQKAVKPVFLIGGINLSNMDELLNLGAKNIALIRGILEAKDIKAQSAAFKKKLEQRSILYGYKDKR